MKTTISNHTIVYNWSDGVERPLSEEDRLRIRIALANEYTNGALIREDLFSDQKFTGKWEAFANDDFLLFLQDW